jgi:hypothetical protein
VPRKRGPSKRIKKLAAAASPEEIEAFYRACEAVNQEPSETLRLLASAFADHVSNFGYIIKPLRFADAPKGRP